MALIQPIELNRNYGAMTTAREFWGGNNGFLTVAVKMPVGYFLPSGTLFDAAVAAGADDAAKQLVESNANRNLFRIAQSIGQRAVVVAVSDIEEAVTTATMVAFANPTTMVTGNVIACGLSHGVADAPVTTAADADEPIYYVTFLIERADVFTKQDEKPGSAYPVAISVDAADELAKNLLKVYFENSTYTQAPSGQKLTGATAGVTAAGVKVFDALPVLK